MSYPYLAKTTLKYKSPHATDLSFAKDETVTGPSPDDEDWLVGESLDGSRSGGFPKDFTMRIEGDATSGDTTATTETVSAEPPSAQETSKTDPAPVPPTHEAPPSPKIEPSALLAPTPEPATKPAPTPAAPSAPSADPDSPPKQSMKDRLAFFAAAQNKAAPPPPLKPKPATGGLTWSQRQKLRQEQEEKERAEREARGEDPVSAAPASTPAPSTAPIVPSTGSDEQKDSGGMSAADAASSIGAGGSLKERMAALRAGGAFGAPKEETPPPPKPSGKVWSRPPAPPEPEPVEGEEEGNVEAEGVKDELRQESEEPAKNTQNDESEGEEETEEDKEKARRAAIAARMAKIGARGPMGMAPPAPPKPARKPTRETITSPTEERTQPLKSTTDEVAPEPVPADKNALQSGSSPDDVSALSSQPTSVPIAAIPRRAAPPRRRGPAASAAKAPSSSDIEGLSPSVERVNSAGEIEPPPQIMVANEEKPLTKTTEELEEESHQVEAARGEGGSQGAVAAGIAIAPVEESPPDTSSESSQPLAGAAAGADIEDRGIGRAVDHDAGDIITRNDDGWDEDGEDESDAEKDDILRDAAAGRLNIASPPNVGEEPTRPEPVAMVPLHSPAPSGPSVNDDEDDPVPPPPPNRSGMTGLPKDEIELKHEQEEQDEEDDDAPPAPPRATRSGSDRPLGPRPLPSPAKERALPPPPVVAGLVPPRSEEEDDHEANGDGDEEDDLPPPPPARPNALPALSSGATKAAPLEEAVKDHDDEDEEDAPPPPPRRPSVPVPTSPLRSKSKASEHEDYGEEEEAAPPPPARRPSVPAPIQTNVSGSPTHSSPVVARSPVPLPRSPIVSTASPIADASIDEGDEEDEEKSRRSGIAARMAKLGGIKFGMPPPTFRKSSTTSDVPTSPVRETRISTEAPDPTESEPSGGHDEPQTPLEPISEPHAAVEDDDESPEAQAARRRATLARLRAGGALGFGMFNHGPASTEQQQDDRGLEGEDESEEAPPPPPGRPDVVSAGPAAGDEDDAPPAPVNRPPPSANQNNEVEAAAEEEEYGAPPPPPSRPTRQPSDVPTSPVRSLSGNRPPVPSLEKRMSGQAPLSPARASHIRTDSTELRLTSEPAVMPMSQNEEDNEAPPPPPPNRPRQAPPASPVYEQAPSSPIAPSHKRSSSVASRFSMKSKTSGESPIARQASIGHGGPVPRQSFQEDRVPPALPEQGEAQFPASPSSVQPSTQGSGRPGFDALVAASRESGSRLTRAARAMFDQGKKAYYGDGSPAGFVAIAMDNAHIARPQTGWGQLVYEQESGSVLKRYDEPRPGDIAAFHDARLKGRKGLQSYEQHVGSVEEPLLGIVVDFEVKNKHKIKALQVERGVPEEVSYRLDDLKSGRVAIYRPGI